MLKNGTNLKALSIYWCPPTREKGRTETTIKTTPFNVLTAYKSGKNLFI